MSAFTSILAGILGAATTATSILQGSQQNNVQKSALAQQQLAQQQAFELQKKQADASEAAVNAANAKQPDMQKVLANIMREEKGTATMLTGMTGIDPQSLPLGKKTLLGQ